MTETICHHLLNFKNRKGIAVEYVFQKRWKTATWTDYYNLVEKFAGGLKSLGVQPGDKIAIFANTRFEWAIADMATLGLGCITIPIYQSSLPEEVEFILQNSEANTVVFESQETYKRYQKIAGNLTTVKNHIGMSFSHEGLKNYAEIYELGEKYRLVNPNFFSQSCLNTKSDDLATIVYTSGTTGTPKGVCLHHEQIISEVSEIIKTVDVGRDDKTLTFLPYAHVLGRIEHWLHVYAGFTMAYAESIEKIKDNLGKAKPTFMIAVPRIFEKFYAAMQSQVETSATKKKIFEWALKVGKQVSDSKIQKKILPIKTLLEYQVAKRMVFDKILEKMGGRLRFAVSGGAPLSAEIGRFFHAANLLILEGYGLTETTGAAFVNTPYDYKFGTVGKPIGDVQVKIASDGEICLKSKKVMRSYYKNPEATSEVFDDEGYFKTGDIGEVDSDGFLKITDRKKDLIKTAGGKYVAPQKLENLLKLDKNVSNVLIHGDRKKYIVTLITLNPLTIQDYAVKNQISYRTFEDLSQHPRIKDLIRNAVANVNSQLASYETIKNFAILSKDFTIDDGELTPSLKVKRKFCDKKYEPQIRALYGDEFDLTS